MLRVNSRRQTIKFPSAQLFEVPEKAFLLVSVFFGILFLLITPPFQVADEPAHFWRSYQIAEGRFIAEKQQNEVGGLIPKSLPDTAAIWDDIPFHPEKKADPKRLYKASSIPLQERERVFWKFTNTAFYSPIPYMPQALGIALGKVLSLSPIILMYLGRLFNLLTSVYLTFLSLKATPIFKWVFFLLALTPMAVFQRSSLSADSSINAISFLLIATILKCAFNQQKNKVEITDILVLFILTALLSLSKQAYFLLPFLYFLIPQARVGSRKKYLTLAFLLILTSAIAWISWGWIIKEIYVPLKQEGISITEQARFILSHPINYAFILLSSLILNTRAYLKEFVGILGWLDTEIPLILWLSYAAVIGLTALIEHKKDIAIEFTDRIKLFLVSFSTIVLIYTLVYLSWTPVGQAKVEGIQGRYFIPISPMMCLLLYNRKIKLDIKANRLDLVIVLYSISALTATLAVVIKRYYNLAWL